MDIGIVSRRYAKALIEYAQGLDVVDQIYKEVSMLEHSFRHTPDLRKALENPMLTTKNKQALICAATAGEREVSKEFIRFIQLVLKHRRENLLQYICISYISLYRKMRNIGVGKLTTAVPVSEEVRERIRKSASSVLQNNYMELQIEVDPAIEGGFIFDVNDQRLDASIATQLKRIKQQFIDKNRRIV